MPKRGDKQVPLQDLSREELETRVQQLEAHVIQLKNVIAKQGCGAIKSFATKQKPFNFNKFSKRHVLLKFAYLGWDYHGYASQEDNNVTIESVLFQALLKTRLIESRESSNYHRCGRTDKGVSAFSQVISIDVRSNMTSGLGVIPSVSDATSSCDFMHSSDVTSPADTPPQHDVTRSSKVVCLSTNEPHEEIRYAHILNKVLPPEVRVLAWAPVSPSTSARFDCKQRTYKYFFPRGDLDIQLMREASKHLVGEHDFRNLCKMDVGNGVVSYNRKIISVDITISKNGDDKYTMCELTITGLAFLWHQIRCIVAVLYLVGQGKEPPSVVTELLDIAKHPRKPQYSLASELPLNLYDCQYGGVKWEYDLEALCLATARLQKTWTQHAVRCAMLQRMLGDMEALCEDGRIQNNLVECLLGGVRSKVYKPLLERPTCESLEERIQHYEKRRRLDPMSKNDRSLEPSETEEKLTSEKISTDNPR